MDSIHVITGGLGGLIIYFEVSFQYVYEAVGIAYSSYSGGKYFGFLEL